MSKTPFILLAGAVAGLNITDVIRISFHPEKIKSAPGVIAGLARDGSAYENTRAGVIRLKRAAEQRLVPDDQQQFAIAKEYVQADSGRLNSLLEGEGSWDSEKVVAQAELLAESLDRLREQSDGIPTETLAAARSALRALDRLQLTQAADILQTSLTEFGLGDVAGEQDGEKNEDETPIPLKF